MGITAEDLWPLVAKLPPAERRKLVRLALVQSDDAESYRTIPVAPDEFTADEVDPLSWDAEGWDEIP